MPDTNMLIAEPGTSWEADWLHASAHPQASMEDTAVTAASAHVVEQLADHQERSGANLPPHLCAATDGAGEGTQVWSQKTSVRSNPILTLYCATLDSVTSVL